MDQEKAKYSITALEEFQRENRRFVLDGNVIRFMAKTAWKVLDEEPYTESNIVIEWDFEPATYGHIRFIDPERSKKQDFVYHQVYPDMARYLYHHEKNALEVESGGGKIHIEIIPMKRQNIEKEMTAKKNDDKSGKERIIIEVEPNAATTVIGITRRLLPKMIEYLKYSGEEAGLRFNDEYFAQMEEIFDELYEKCIEKTSIREGAAKWIEALELTGQLSGGKES